MTNINGIHYEISEPVQNQNDGYFYQRYRQVDDKGNVVGSGDRMIRSARPDSQDGLFDPNGNVAAGFRTAYGTARVAQILAGILLRKPAWVADGAKKITETLSIEPPEFLKRDYKKWPGTDKPWEGAPSEDNGLTKPSDGLGKQGLGLPGSDPHSGIPPNVRDEALVNKMNLTANGPFDPLNIAGGKVSGPQALATRMQLFQGPNGQPVTDAAGWQNGIDSSLEQAPRLRLVPQPRDDSASAAFIRTPVDQGRAASSAPALSDETSELLKLRSIIQAVGSRGLFPIQ